LSVSCAPHGGRRARHRLAPLEDVPLVAVGHSLGACLAIVEQALHGSYDAVANLGFTHGGKEVIENAPASGQNEDAATPMQVAIDQAKAFLATDWDAGYGAAPRAPHHGWPYAADVPAEVIAVDDKASAWPRQSYVGALGWPPATRAGRRRARLIARDRDVLERPHDDVAFYRASQDVTLVVLAGSAHCHNFASTRIVLDRFRPGLRPSPTAERSGAVTDGQEHFAMRVSFAPGRSAGARAAACKIAFQCSPVPSRG
jgi:hypothetical protein